MARQGPVLTEFTVLHGLEASDGRSLTQLVKTEKVRYTFLMGSTQTTNDLAQVLSLKVLGLLNQTGSREDLIISIVKTIQRELKMESVGIRLNSGEDYPYFFTSGFEESFVSKEKYLCARNADGKCVLDAAGTAVLECMCGAVIMGKTNPELPHFTPYGSFWTNGLQKLAASFGPQDFPDRVRGRCIAASYETMALIPIRSEGVTYGLLQLNDHRLGLHSRELIEMLEGLCISIGLVFALKNKEEELAQHRRNVDGLSAARMDSLAKTVATLGEQLQQIGPSDPRSAELLKQLATVVSELSALQGMMTVCCVCKNVRDGDGYWQKLEALVADKTSVKFSHTYCPQCSSALRQSLKN